MSRHRNVRALNAEEEFEGYDDVYGHSYDDGEFGVSPGTAGQFLYNRDKSNVTFASVMGAKESIEEEPENLEANDVFTGRRREPSGESSGSGGGGGGGNASSSFGAKLLRTPMRARKTSQEFVRPQLSQADEVRLSSCVEEIQNVLGDSVPDWSIIDAVVAHNFDFEKSLDFLLKSQQGDATAEDDEEPLDQSPSSSSSSRTTAAMSVGGSGARLFPSTSDLPPLTPPPLPASHFLSASSDLSHSPKVVLASPKPQRSAKRGRQARKSGGEEDRRADPSGSSSVSKDDDDIAATFGGDSTSARTLLLVDDEGLESVGDGYQTPTKQLKAIERLKLDDESGSRTPTGYSSDNERDGTSTPPPDGGVGGAVTPSRRLRDRLKMLERYAERTKETKSTINLVVVGHVDSGKSTLMGHLLYKTGNVTKKAMHKFEQDSKKVGKASFAYAWVLDETEEERNRGVTIDVAQSKFETDKQSINLLDAPGHRDFIPNMITGAAQADAAIMVVNSTRGEFESGYDAGGQTREHGLLVRSLGVQQIIVAVNKLDTVNWEQRRYDEIVKKMYIFLKQIGYKESDISFVPCSGLLGENLTSGSAPPELVSWYGADGLSLLQRVDELQPPERAVDKPLRLCISDVFKGMGSGICVAGKIEAGSATGGDRALVMPACQTAIIKLVAIDDVPTDYGFAGDQVVITLTGVNETALNVGSVICDPEDPIKVASHFVARVVVFNINFPLTQGYPLVFHCKSYNEPCVLKKLIALVNKATGEETKRRPKCLTKGASALVEVAFPRPVCVELYKDMKELGRFMLRCGDKTIAAGMVTSIIA